MSVPSWLPALFELRDAGGDWQLHVNVAYKIFEMDFVQNPPLFEGMRVKHTRPPIRDGKVFTFQHIASEGNDEQNRLPSPRRTAFIRWIKPIIEHVGCQEVLAWENSRGTSKRISLWLKEMDYLVVLERRPGAIFLWTAYEITYDRKRAQLQKEYDSLGPYVPPDAGDYE